MPIPDTTSTSTATSPPRGRRALAALAAGLALTAAAATACAPQARADRYSRAEARRALAKAEAPGLVLGEFRPTKIVDGDTIHVDGLGSSLRLLGIDAEETFKTEADRRAYEAGWEAYLRGKRAGGRRPVKAATPMGDAAKDWAKHWFDGVRRVRLERDHPAEIRDRYDRYLAYVIADKGGRWINYNVELVRAGLSPYFPKYGRSRRFHREFVAAEAEAKAARRGIWAPGVRAYPDYPEREAWWAARGDFVEAFRAAAAGKRNYIDLTHVNALSELEAQLGKEVHVLGTVDDVRRGRGPARAMLERFPVIFFDPDVLYMSGVTAWRGEYVIVTGRPTIYENKHTHQKQLQIVIDRASQVRLSPVPGLTPPAASPALAPAAPPAPVGPASASTSATAP